MHGRSSGLLCARLISAGAAGGLLSFSLAHVNSDTFTMT
jgi:hypothetical protein